MPKIQPNVCMFEKPHQPHAELSALMKNGGLIGSLSDHLWSSTFTLLIINGCQREQDVMQVQIRAPQLEGGVAAGHPRSSCIMMPWANRDNY